MPNKVCVFKHNPTWNPLLEVSLLLFRTGKKYSFPSGVRKLLPVLARLTGTILLHTTASTATAASNSECKSRCIASLRSDRRDRYGEKIYCVWTKTTCICISICIYIYNIYTAFYRKIYIIYLFGYIHFKKISVYLPVSTYSYTYIYIYIHTHLSLPIYTHHLVVTTKSTLVSAT